MESRLCPVCRCSEKTILFHQNFSGFSDNNLLSSYDVVSCDDCGFCFADKIPDQTDFNKYYRDLSKYENIGAEIKESPYDLHRFNIFVDYMEPFLKDNR